MNVITIKIVRRPKWIGGSGVDNQWVAEELSTHRRGTSFYSPRSAVENCACNFFFGGSTKAKRGSRGVLVERDGNKFKAMPLERRAA